MTEGSRMLISTARMAMTTRSSMRVNPIRRPRACAAGSAAAPGPMDRLLPIMLVRTRDCTTGRQDHANSLRLARSQTELNLIGMRIHRFRSGKDVFYGVPSGSRMRVIRGDLFGEHHLTDEEAPMDKLLAPLVPTDILCIGINYREHAAESESTLPQNP